MDGDELGVEGGGKESTSIFCVHVYLFVAAESGIAIGDCVDTPLVGS